MNVAVVVLVLALFWGAISGSFSGANLLLGAAIGLAATLLLRNTLAPPRSLLKVRQFMGLFVLFVRELAVSAVRVAIVVLSPDIRSALSAEVIAFPLSVKSDAEITLLANLVTLTPGTLSIDLSPDRSVLYVHVLAGGSREAVIADIARGFEARIRELFA